MMLEGGGTMLGSGQTPAASFSSNLFLIFTVQSQKKIVASLFPIGPCCHPCLTLGHLLLPVQSQVPALADG